MFIILWRIFRVFFLLVQILPFPGMKLGIPEWLKCSRIPTPPSSSALTTLSTWTLLITKYVIFTH